MTFAPHLARRVGALLTALVGIMNIVSALYPEIPSRIELLQGVIPVHLIRSAETATVLVGFALILLADGLRKRRRRAMQVTVVLLAISSILNVLKGLDIEEAVVGAGLAAALAAYARSFDIPSRLPAPRHIVQRLATFALLYYGYVLAGFLILRHKFFPAPSVSGALAEPFRLLYGDPMYTALTPHAQWFERSLAAVGSVALLVVVVQLLRPLVPRSFATSDDIGHARRLVERYGSDTLSYFALQDGRSYFFDVTGEAFLSYRLWDTTALVGGDPVGRGDRIAPLLRAFVEYCDESGMEPCLLGVSRRYEMDFASAGMRLLKIGEEALIDLSTFDVAVLKRKVRRAARHAGELGIRLEVFRPYEVPPPVQTQLERINHEWIAAKGGEHRGFSMTLGRLPRPSDADCELVVALEGDRVWGYMSLVPVYPRHAWSLDAMRRCAEAPNGLTEFMIIGACQHYRARGYTELSLNFAALSNTENDIASRSVESTRRFLFENLSNTYQLKSLYQFNSKFEPTWQSRYLAYRDVLKIPRLALAVVQCEDPIRLPSLVSVLRR